MVSAVFNGETSQCPNLLHQLGCLQTNMYTLLVYTFTAGEHTQGLQTNPA